MRGGGVAKSRRGVKKTKCGGGGCCGKNFEGGGYAGEGNEDKMRGGVARKI